MAAIVFLGESVNIAFVVGVTIILFGLLISNRKIPLHVGYYTHFKHRGFTGTVKQAEHDVAQKISTTEKRIVAAARANLR